MYNQSPFEFESHKKDLEKMQAKIDFLKEEARSQSEKVSRKEFEDQVRIAEAQANHLSNKLKKASEQSPHLVEDLKVEIDQAWNDLRQALNRAYRYFH